MALPAFDPAKHHIGLGAWGGANHYGFVLDGSYNAVPAKVGQLPEQGGNTDLLASTVYTRWTQDDFSGGAYEDTWDDDAGMFAYAKNMLPGLQDDYARTIPPLVIFAEAGHVSADQAVAILVTGGSAVTAPKIAVVFDNKTDYYDTITGGKTSRTYDVTLHCVARDPTDNMLYYCGYKDSDSSKWLRRFNIHPEDPVEGIKKLPDNMPTPFRGMEMTAGRDIILAANTTLYLLDVNDARDDATVTRIGRLPGFWRDSCTYNGLTYVLFCDEEGVGLIHAWDGTQMLPVTAIPYNFNPVCITEYAGRLYVGGTGRDITGAKHYAEFYEITGSSLRLVRSFAYEALAGRDRPRTIYDMVVHEGTLFLATDVGYLIGYDVTRDALWPNIEILAGGREVEARALVSTRKKLVAWCYDPNRTNDVDGFFRVATEQIDLTGIDSYTCYLETSDFGPEIDRKKVWSKLRVLHRFGANPTLKASSNSGSTWTNIDGVTTDLDGDGDGKLRYTDFDLADFQDSVKIRFRFVFEKTAITPSEILAFTLEYLTKETGKRQFSFTILAVDRVEQLDGTGYVQSVKEVKDQLWAWGDGNNLLKYTDVDGTEFRVLMTDVSEMQPEIGPALDGDSAREAFFSVTLTEV